MKRTRAPFALFFVLNAGCAEGVPLSDGTADAAFGLDSKADAKPPGLISYLVGNPADAPVAPGGPGLILMGGGPDVDEAFTWWRPKLNGGDVVVLRTSGADGYNDYLYHDIGGCDSVETLLVTSPALANTNYVAARLNQAEGIFLAGGDQATYLAAWRGTRVERALQDAWARGAVVGGTSAGCAVLGEFVYSAENGTVFSSEALADPFDFRVTLEPDFLRYPPLRNVLTDTHFKQRNRMGRLAAFAARLHEDGTAAVVRSLGVDERTALLVDADGFATVAGQNHVYVLDAAESPATCEPGVPLSFTGLSLAALGAGDTVRLPAGPTSVAATPLDVLAGQLHPANPYASAAP
ncbi:MAG: cyanophycinase [Polyangiaceae bacterium]|jgi:cyanophycinase|nr:cyanophycinase [Polyangiaceae bacterium]